MFVRINMKIGILGGSFNPPHLGHLLISVQVWQILKLDEIWLMPNNTHPFQKSLSPVFHRLAMTKLLENDFIKVSEYEINRNEENYTIDTMSYFTRNCPDYIFYWIGGSDQLDRFREYKEWRELVKNYNLVIFPREIVYPQIEEKVKQKMDLKVIPKNIFVLRSDDLVMSNVSSSIIRQRIRNGESIKYMVPGGVEKYIKENNLYLFNLILYRKSMNGTSKIAVMKKDDNVSPSNLSMLKDYTILLFDKQIVLIHSLLLFIRLTQSI